MPMLGHRAAGLGGIQEVVAVQTARGPMSEEVRPNVSVAIARALLLEIEVDRPKRIDQYLDYFGESAIFNQPSPRERRSG